MGALAKFGYVDLEIEVDQEAKTYPPPAHKRPSDFRELELEGFFAAESGSRADVSVPSESGVSRRSDRVAEMRDLYVRGDVNAALALGASLASLFEAIQGEERIEEDFWAGDAEDSLDPFGGLQVVTEDELAQEEADEADAQREDGHTSIFGSGTRLR